MGQEVRCISLLQQMFLEVNVQFGMGDKRSATVSKLNLESFLINGLQKARSQNIVNLHRRTNDVIDLLLMKQLHGNLDDQIDTTYELHEYRSRDCWKTVDMMKFPSLDEILGVCVSDRRRCRL